MIRERYIFKRGKNGLVQLFFENRFHAFVSIVSKRNGPQAGLLQSPISEALSQTKNPQTSPIALLGMKTALYNARR